MDDVSNWLAFLAIAVAATASPGPAVLLSIKNGANHGFSRTLVSICGNVTAMLLYAALATAGVTILFSDAPQTIQAIQIVGGCYLTYVGIRLCRKTTQPIPPGDTRRSSAPPARLFGEAVLVGASNPKAIIFYTALFPQFIDPDAPVLPQAILLPLTFAVCSFAALSTYAWISSKASGLLSNGKGLDAINTTAGFLFILLGGGLVLQSLR